MRNVKVIRTFGFFHGFCDGLISEMRSGFLRRSSSLRRGVWLLLLRLSTRA